jgi:hypothetical protein
LPHSWVAKNLYVPLFLSNQAGVAIATFHWAWDIIPTGEQRQEWGRQMSASDTAKSFVDDWANKTDKSEWKNIDRADLAQGLKDRVDFPDLVSSDGVNLCGPAAYFRNLAEDKPIAYVNFGMQLYDQYCSARDLKAIFNFFLFIDLQKGTGDASIVRLRYHRKHLWIVTCYYKIS